MPEPETTQAAVRTIRLGDEQIAHLLERLDAEGKQPSTDGEKREYKYRRKGLIVDMLQPGAVTPTRYVVQPRQISNAEMWFLHGSFLHTGTQCTVQLVSLHGTWTSAVAAVALCVYVEENIHDVCVRFAHPIDPALYCPEAGRTRVLFVESDATLARLAIFHLSQLNADVDHIEDSSQAVEHTAKNRYDLIIIGVEAQSGVGFEVVEALRSKGYSRTIVAFTALTEDDDRNRCLEAGCDHVLAKPFTREDMNSLLQSLRQEPLFSTFYDDPSMAQLINTFVEELPDKVLAIEQAVLAEDQKALQGFVRSLRAQGTSYGFEVLTEAAEKVEEKMTGGASVPDLRYEVDCLVRLCMQARCADTNASS